MAKGLRKMDQHNRWYYEYKEDIAIAIDELSNMKLYPPKGRYVCDLYAVPAHNYQTYYALIYECNGVHKMLYAKPEVQSPHYAAPTKICRFKDAKKAEKFQGFDGKVIMGIKNLDNSFISIISDIIENLPSDNVIDTGNIVIDGVFQAIRVFKNNAVEREYVFDSPGSIVFPDEKNYLNNILENLHICVDEISG